MRWWLVIGWVWALTACGQAGDLYLPDHRSAAPARPASAAAPATAATAGGR